MKPSITTYRAPDLDRGPHRPEAPERQSFWQWRLRRAVHRRARVLWLLAPDGNDHPRKQHLIDRAGGRAAFERESTALVRLALPRLERAIDEAWQLPAGARALFELVRATERQIDACRNREERSALLRGIWRLCDQLDREAGIERWFARAPEVEITS